MKGLDNRDLRPYGKFGEWMCCKLEELGYTYESFVKLLQLPKYTVLRHVEHITKPKYLTVVGYCYYLKDDPKDIWKLVEADWG